MNARIASTEGNVTRLRPRKPEPTPTSKGSNGQRAEAARYITQMTLELERLANTGDMELVGYFLAMARAEAEAAANEPDDTPLKQDSQAPYHAD